MTDFKDLISQAKQMKAKMESAQAELKKIEIEGASGANAVKIIMDGDGNVKKILLDDNLLKESKEIIEDLIVAAHNDAKSKLKKKMSEELSKVTGGINLPPGFRAFLTPLTIDLISSIWAKQLLETAKSNLDSKSYVFTAFSLK